MHRLSETKAMQYLSTLKIFFTRPTSVQKFSICFVSSTWLKKKIKRVVAFLRRNWILIVSRKIYVCTQKTKDSK